MGKPRDLLCRCGVVIISTVAILSHLSCGRDDDQTDKVDTKISEKTTTVADKRPIEQSSDAMSPNESGYRQDELELLVKKKQFLPDQYPYEENPGNMLRIAWSKERSFHRVNKKVIHTNDVVNIELVNNTNSPQAFQWGGLWPFFICFEIKGVEPCPLLGPSVIGRASVLLPSNAIRVAVEIAHGVYGTQRRDVTHMEPGCYDTALKLFARSMKEPVRLCYKTTEKADKKRKPNATGKGP
ncbi:MAG: hypothetical protein GY847_16485 [Proteobacteria bacterium]|nr:hypothetical protein [Pseudomonadota bacterium]